MRHKPPYTVPRDELLYITPEARKKLFYNLLQNYKVFCPGMTLQYAYLNFNSKIPIDYCVVFSAIGKNKEKITAWSCPYIFGWDSIPGYRYAVKNNLHDKFFAETSSMMARIRTVRFNEFIEMMCQLSVEDGESCWKNEEFADTVLDNLSEMALRYTPQTK